ncbi:putative permease, YjgP/YjgQ family, partial [Waddlia chondrophila 2032/99]
MLTKIWERYFIKETLKTFFFISFCFYGLYVLIDYASHSGARHHQSMMEWSELIKFYANEWILRADVLVPFALMIATIRTLCDLNIHNELVALQASGISLKKILRPFIFLGLLFTLLIYANTEFLLPNAMAASRHLRNQKEIQKNNKNKKFFVQHVGLKDGSTLLYQHYNFAERSFFDAYWVKSFDEIWRFQHLSPYEQPPKGIGVGHFQRMPDNTLHKIESFESRSFPEMKFNQKILLDTLTPSRELSLSTLWKRLPHSKEIGSESSL